MPLSPVLDTAGFLTRDPLLWHAAAKAMYLTNITSDFPSLPKKILTAGFPTAIDTDEASLVLLEFLSKLQAFLEADTPAAIDPATIWAANPPAAANGASLSAFISNAYPTLISQQQYKLLTLPFYADYAAVNAGKRPFVDPSPLIRWAYGQNNVSSEGTNQAINNATIFKGWWEETVMLPSAESCSESLLLYVQSDGSPTYRNVYRRYILANLP